MGFRGDIRRRRQQVDARVPPGASKRERLRASMDVEREAELDRRTEKRRAAVDALAPGTEAPFVEHLRHQDAKALGLGTALNTLSEVYVAVVAIRPEDVFGIYPCSVSTEQGFIHEMAIAYRDSDAYRSRREQFWEGLRSARGRG